MLSTQEIYETVRSWPVAEQVKFAALILNDVSHSDALTSEGILGSSDHEITSDEIQDALGRVYARYSDTLKRLAE
jgi:hypothetical protein